MKMKNTKIDSEDYRVRVIDLPHAIKGFVALDEDGFPNIYLNARITSEARRETLRHELNHLARNDFYNDLDIRSVEA